jgi:YVTN family beta-propeller protein
MARRLFPLAAAMAVPLVVLPLLAQDAPRPGAAPAPGAAPRFAGPVPGGFLLPNGWTITPAGEQIELPDLPLNILPLPDGRHALAATSGFNDHVLAVVDLEAKKVVAQETVKESWFGLAHDPAGGTVWWAGGGASLIHEYTLNDSIALARKGPAEADRSKLSKKEKAAQKSFTAGLAHDAARKVLYSLDIDAGLLMAVPQGENPGSSKPLDLGGRPYDVALSRDGKKLYVSDWAEKSVAVVDADALTLIKRIPVGIHPNQIAVHPEDGRVFVACASSNGVWAIDPARDEVAETIYTTLFPKAPEGSTPDALAISPDGETLYVANADNNCVAVVDIETPRQSAVKGFIPTGWYPTAVAVTPDGKTLLVGVGKGNATKPNPIFKDKGEAKGRGRAFPYIGTTLSGALSLVPIPDEKQLAAWTEQVYKNCPYSDKLLTDAPHPEKTAIPTKVGEPSPIEHVIYIIKENRTYDQLFGDIERGNGDPSLVMFGRDVTPNHHKLAEEFVLLDNLYCNGHVSADGHPWSTMAYNTDYIARNWALTYSGRAGVDDDDEGDLSNAPSGYLWDSCAKAGLSYRSYGEYGRRVSQPDGTFKMEGRVPGLVGHFCPDWGIPTKPGQPVRDTDRVETFLKEFRQYEKDGKLPRFIVMSLGEDHTTGTAPGTFTPQACVASNDLALGRLVEAVSRSAYWPRTAIFVIEDDAQNGPDHVDAHRTVGLVISPYTKRKHLDSTHYQTVSMIRTMELILGLPPLSQFDAAANPMFRSFTDRPDPTPYAVEPPRIDLDAKNAQTAYGADRSARMDFAEYDRINDFELNEILWRAIKGADAPLPPSVRRAIAYRPRSE